MISTVSAHIADTVDLSRVAALTKASRGSINQVAQKFLFALKKAPQTMIAAGPLFYATKLNFTLPLGPAQVQGR